MVDLFMSKVKGKVKNIYWWLIVTGLMFFVRVKCSIAGAIVGWKMWDEEMARQARLAELINK